MPLFSNEDVYLLSFEDEDRRAAMLHFSANTNDGPLTAFIDEQPAVLAPALQLLEELAMSIGSDFLVYGFDLKPWRALTSDAIYDNPSSEFRMRRIGWRNNSLSTGRLRASWGDSSAKLGPNGYSWIRV